MTLGRAAALRENFSLPRSAAFVCGCVWSKWCGLLLQKLQFAAGFCSMNIERVCFSADRSRWLRLKMPNASFEHRIAEFPCFIRLDFGNVRSISTARSVAAEARQEAGWMPQRDIRLLLDAMEGTAANGFIVTDFRLSTWLCCLMLLMECQRADAGKSFVLNSEHRMRAAAESAAVSRPEGSAGECGIR